MRCASRGSDSQSSSFTDSASAYGSRSDSKEMRDLRLALGMTQDAFAFALDVDIRTVQRWEYGTTGISARRADAVRALAKAAAHTEANDHG